MDGTRKDLARIQAILDLKLIEREAAYTPFRHSASLLAEHSSTRMKASTGG